MVCLLEAVASSPPEVALTLSRDVQWIRVSIWSHDLQPIGCFDTELNNDLNQKVRFAVTLIYSGIHSIQSARDKGTSRSTPGTVVTVTTGGGIPLSSGADIEGHLE